MKALCSLKRALFISHEAFRAGVHPLLQYLRAGKRRRRLSPPPRRDVDKPRSKLRPARETVVFLGHDAHRLGAETLSLHLLRWLKQKTALDIRLILGRGGELLDEFKRIGEVLVLENLFRIGAGRAEIENAIRSHCGDDVKLVYTNTVACGRYLDYFKFLNVPILAHVHELENAIRLTYSDDAREMVRHCTRYVGASAAVSRNLVANHGVAADRIDTIYEFVTPTGVTPTPKTKRATRRKLGLSEDKVLLFGCGAVYSRKGSDLFVAVAERLLRAGVDDFHCYWIGPFVPGEQSRIEREIKSRGVGSHVTFLGPKDNPREWFSAGDVFLLPSREDPFPLVCLEAAECGMPIVCFADAGGMPDFVQDDAGFVVPWEDVGQMAEKTALMIRERELRERLGGAARRKYLTRHTTDRTMPQVLQTIRKTAGIAPSVSVIVPCYNHASYLKQRFASVFGQTFQDFELIILDDCSPDHSRQLINEYRATPNVRVIFNKKNGGSTLAQWMKGIDLARGEIIWIAEDDDYCEPDFLERLLACFADREVKLAYCQSVAVDDRGKKLFSYRSYTTDLSKSRWCADYVAPAAEELNSGLAVKNTIPNASAVVFRKFDLAGLRSDLAKYRLCGDWLFYIHAIRGGKVAFCSDELNYHRRHDSTCIARYKHDGRRFVETRDVQDVARETAPLSNDTLRRMNAHLLEVWKACFPQEPQQKYFRSIANARLLPVGAPGNGRHPAAGKRAGKHVRTELQRARRRIAQLQHELSLIRGSRTWRLRGRLLRAGHRLGIAPRRRETRTVRPCTIIIPVYNTFHEALVCVRSVLKHTAGPFRLRVIDDASPKGAFADFLPENILADPRVWVSRNAKNLGFVRTCNLGMREAVPDDVVLLNSDTEVTAGWLDKLQDAAYSRPQVGSVTPLTNNGTICSVPDFLSNNKIPDGYGVDDFAALVERVSAREYREAPTCVGFCAYVKREVLDRIGYFDENSFGKGYGEENDFSCRARAAGYVDIIDDATFIHHKGQMSFQDRTQALVAEHLKILEAKHPGYSRRVQKFVRKNPLRKVHQRIEDAMFRRWMERAERCILHVLHDSPLTPRANGGRRFGGTEFQVADLIRSIPTAAHWSLYPKAGGYRLTAHVPGTAERHFQFSPRQFNPAGLLDPEVFDVIHLHHVLGFDWSDLAKALLRHGNYFVSLHDFRMVCPRIQLLTPSRRLCSGRECSTACKLPQLEVERLRSITTRILRGAQAVLHFSKSTREHFSRIVGNDYPWKLLEHGIDIADDFRESTGSPNGRNAGFEDRPSGNRPLKVAFLNGGLPHKGVRLLKQLIKHRTLPSGVPLRWHIIGGASEKLPKAPHIAYHGRYDREQLPKIMDRVRPHLVGILSVWPETYCFTLDEAIRSGVPVISTPLGAPADRVRQHGCGWVLDRLDAESFLQRLQCLTENWDQYRAARRRLARINLQSVDQVGARYEQMYRQASPQRSPQHSAPRLARLDRLSGNVVSSPPRRRSIMATLLAGCENTLHLLRLDALARTMAHRFFPTRVYGYLKSLRQPASPPVSPAVAQPSGAQTRTPRAKKKVA